MTAHSPAWTDEILKTLLHEFPRPLACAAIIGGAMRRLIAQGWTDLPLPGSGQTLERWRALAAVGAFDLSLAKVFEGHTDAVAICAELNGPPPKGLSAVWAAESRHDPLVFRPENGGAVTGRKSWCSGAAVVDEAVISATTEAGKSILVRVDLYQPEVKVETGGWQAVGMAASESGSVVFEGARAQAVGTEGDYVARPGFWQGGAGIAAIWYGGAVAIAQTLALSPRILTDAFAAAHLGAVDVALRSARALLVEAARWIDANPAADASATALRVRAGVETASNEVLLHTGRALGPAPLCGNAMHAQRCADLPVFLRQSHAEHDLAALGEGVARVSPAWTL